MTVGLFVLSFVWRWIEWTWCGKVGLGHSVIPTAGQTVGDSFTKFYRVWLFVVTPGESSAEVRLLQITAFGRETQQVVPSEDRYRGCRGLKTYFGRGS